MNGYFTLLLTSSGQEWHFHITITTAFASSGQEWQLADLPAVLPPVLTSWVVNSHLALYSHVSGQKWQMADLLADLSPLVLTSSEKEWQLADLLADLPPKCIMG